MPRPLAFLLTLMLALMPASSLWAECAGRNILADMPAVDYADLLARAASDPYGSGNHWRATRDGDVIDLIGTMHLNDPRMAAIVERLAPTLRAADALWLEATDVELQKLKTEMARNPTLMFSPGPTLPERLEPKDWADLSAALSNRGIPPFLASKMRPWFVSMLLSVPGCAMSQADGPEQGLDELLQAEARKAGVPVLALEPWDTVLAIFGAMEQTDQIETLRTSLVMARQSEDFFSTMIDVYFDQNHRLAWEMSRDLNRLAPDKAKAEREFAVMEKVLLSDRNRSWIDPVERAAAGHHIVAAFGAAHLSGPDGVLALLAARGWKLERLTF